MADRSDGLVPRVLASVASAGSLPNPSDLPSAQALADSKGGKLHRRSDSATAVTAARSGEEDCFACEDEDDPESTWGTTQRPDAAPRFCATFSMNGPGCKLSTCLGCGLAEAVRSRQTEVAAGCRLCRKTCTRWDVVRYGGVCVGCWVAPPCASASSCGKKATRTDVERFGDT